MATDPTVLGIANQALSLMGVTVPVDDFDDDNTEARMCKLWYDQSRRALLTEAEWPFATETATLNQISTDSFEPLRRTYGYTLPDDLLAIREIWSGNLIDNPRDRIRFEFEVYNGLRVLVSDETEVSIVYTVDVEDPLQFTPLFIEALAAGLAAKLSMALEKGDPNALRDRYVYERQRAAGAALNEIPLEPDPPARSIAARGGW